MLEQLYKDYKDNNNYTSLSILYKEIRASLLQNTKLNRFIKDKEIRNDLISQAIESFLTSKYDPSKSKIITYVNTILSNAVYHYRLNNKIETIPLDKEVYDIPDYIEEYTNLLDIFREYNINPSSKKKDINDIKIKLRSFKGTIEELHDYVHKVLKEYKNKQDGITGTITKCN